MSKNIAGREELTERLITLMEKGSAPWQKPWDDAVVMPYNPTSNREYNGGNVINLMCRSYSDPRWCTFKQAADKGWGINKGEHGTKVEYWKFYDEIKYKDENGKDSIARVKRTNPAVFIATVFNAEQMSNVPALDTSQKVHSWSAIEKGEEILSQSGAKIIHKASNRAYYSSMLDEICLPNKEQFAEAARYYGTALHELAHWTGHESRLDRKLTDVGMDVPVRAREELRADIASYFIAMRTGIPNDPSQNAAYVESWIKALKNDVNEIYRASKDADTITKYLTDYEYKKTLKHDVDKELIKTVGKEIER